jgi:ATP-binding cassette, subfamily B, bacterial
MPKSPTHPHAKPPSYRQLLPYLRPHALTLFFAVLASCGFVATLPITASLVGRAAPVLGQGNFTALTQILALIAGLFLLRGIFIYAQDVMMAKAVLKLVFDLRLRVYRHLQQLGLDYFETTPTGDLTYRLTEDIDRIGEVLNRALHQGIPCTLTLVVLLGYMISLDWTLLLATLILAPLIAILASWFGNRLLSVAKISQSRIANLATLLTEVLSGMSLVKAFAAEAYEQQRFAQLAQQNQQARFAAEQLKALQFPVVAFIQVVGVLFLFGLGAWQIAQGRLTGAAFVSFLTGIALMIEPIQQLTATYNDLKESQASLERVFELLQHQPTVVEGPQAPDLPHVTGKVEYQQVSFSYQPGQPVLNGFNLLAQPGEMIALVGHSGAGKSTVMNLLLRFYDPQSGNVLIDGVDIATVNLTSLRRQIGIVPQETTLFAGTIAQNIAFGQLQLDDAKVAAAAKTANADPFIRQFSQGYHTWLGERGVNLSGGQRQRLAIARAIYHDPKILILDEATSALDAESEALVQEALERVMRGRTVFVIAHRLATVRRADRILVLEQGQVVESGRHGELLSLNQGQSRYAQFYAKQFPGEGGKS